MSIRYRINASLSQGEILMRKFASGIPSLLIASVFFLQSCATHIPTSTTVKRVPSSLMSPKYVLSKVGKVETEKGDLNYVHPDLNDTPDPYDQQTLEQMRKKLQELTRITMSDVGPAQLAVPDYQVAQKALIAAISDNIYNYFQDLEVIQKRVKRVFSELLALQQEVEKENHPNGLMLKEYRKDLKLKIPALHKEINAIYAKALGNLFTLQGKLNVRMKGKSSHYRNQIKQQVSSSMRDSIIGICETRICAMKLSSDINAWFAFVEKINLTADFIQFENTKTVWTSNSVKTTPFVTLAIIDAANRLLNFGLKNNKEYTVATALAKHVGDLGKAPAGIVTGIVAAPVYLFEKIGIALGKMHKFMRLELSLESIDAFKSSQIANSSNVEIEKYSAQLNSAVYFGEDEERSEVLENGFVTALHKAIVISPKVGLVLSEEELKIVLRRSNKLAEVFQLADQNLVKKILRELTPEEHADILQKNPQFINYLSQGQLVDVIRRSQDWKKLLPSIALETLVKAAKEFSRSERIRITAIVPGFMKALDDEEVIQVLEETLSRKDDSLYALVAQVNKEQMDRIKRRFSVQLSEAIAKLGEISSTEFAVRPFGKYENSSFLRTNFGVWNYERNDQYKLILTQTSRDSLTVVKVCWGSGDSLLERMEADATDDSIIIHWNGRSNPTKMIWFKNETTKTLGYSFGGSGGGPTMHYAPTQQLNVQSVLGTWLYENLPNHRVRLFLEGQNLKAHVVLWGSDMSDRYLDAEILGDSVVIHWNGKNHPTKMTWVFRNSGQMGYSYNCSNPNSYNVYKVP